MNDSDLLQIAQTARNNAHAPYSEFAVGAALLATDGRVFSGCNVENLSFGLTICAERVAIGSALAAGSREFAVIAVIADSNDPVMPCGACRQVMAEFNPQLRVISSTVRGNEVVEFSLDVLLPKARQGILR